MQSATASAPTPTSAEGMSYDARALRDSREYFANHMHEMPIGVSCDVLQGIVKRAELLISEGVCMWAWAV